LDADHIVIAKRFEEKMNGLLKKTKERKIAKKITNISRGSISKKKCCEGFLPKGGCATKKNLEDLGLLIIKKHLPIHFVKNI